MTTPTDKASSPTQTTTMQAAIVERYGPPDVIELREVPVPTPGKGQVLVRVESTSVNTGDTRMRSGKFPRGFGALGKLAMGIRGPRKKIQGVVFAGTVVESLTSEQGAYSTGTRVAGMKGFHLGSHAQYLAVDESRIAPIPDSVSTEQAAAALFGGSTALCFLRDKADLGSNPQTATQANSQSNPSSTPKRILVNGASGSVGSAAVQLAKHFGAEVTAVCSAANADLVRRLGATYVIDYNKTPVAQLRTNTDDSGFDIVFDAVGNINKAQGLTLINNTGKLILAVATLGETATARGRVITGPIPEKPEQFTYILDLVAKGEFDPLTKNLGGLDALAEAHRQIDTGHKVGNLVINP